MKDIPGNRMKLVAHSGLGMIVPLPLRERERGRGGAVAGSAAPRATTRQGASGFFARGPKRILPVALLAAFSATASAAAFQNWEQDASSLGVAHAGSAATADSAASLYYNPAGLARLDGVQFSAGFTGLRPIADFDDKGSSGPGLGDGGDAGRWLSLPNASLSARLGSDLTLGLGVSRPFALDTRYDSGWLGQTQAQHSEIRTLNINPAIAYRLSDKIALGFGLDYQTIDLDFSRAGQRLKGDDGSWGWNAGALFTLSPNMRVGISYRSAIEHKLDGKVDGEAARASITLPETAILSVWQQVSAQWEAMGDLSYTRWNRLKQVVFTDRASGAALAAEPFTYGNSWRLAWGAAYRVNDIFKFKFGFAWERSPIGNNGRTARLPDADSLRLAFGVQWLLGAWGRLDAGYSYLLMRDAKIAQIRDGNLLRGEYENGAHTAGVQYSLGF
ncbi:MAG: outer membrane protein transport protein [Azonexus sp.]|jgi:long-chain fatty acid transport protein|nr:outer membrane protein transport protein [Azonexus sp.]